MGKDMAKEIKKEEACEHNFMPKVFNTDLGVYGTGAEEDIFMDTTFVIVECSECDMSGYVIAETI